MPRAWDSVRDLTTEGQHFLFARQNLFAAIIKFRSAGLLGRAVQLRRRTGIETPKTLLRHASQLGWGISSSPADTDSPALRLHGHGVAFCLPPELTRI